MPKDPNGQIVKSVEDIDTPLEEALEGTDEICLEEEFDINRTKRTRVPEQHPPELKARAYELYMDHVGRADICAELNIKPHNLAAWIKRGNWYTIRKDNDSSILTEVLDSKKSLISGLALELLQGCLKAVRRDAGKDGFKAKDVPTYLSALSSVEKLSRLSLGLATSISEERSKRANFTLPLEHLKNVQQVKIAQDPFSGTMAAPTAPDPIEIDKHDDDSTGTSSGDSDDPT